MQHGIKCHSRDHICKIVHRFSVFRRRQFPVKQRRAFGYSIPDARQQLPVRRALYHIHVDQDRIRDRTAKTLSCSAFGSENRHRRSQRIIRQSRRQTDVFRLGYKGSKLCQIQYRTSAKTDHCFDIIHRDILRQCNCRIIIRFLDQIQFTFRKIFLDLIQDSRKNTLQIFLCNDNGSAG